MLLYIPLFVESVVNNVVGVEGESHLFSKKQKQLN